MIYPLLVTFFLLIFTKHSTATAIIDEQTSATNALLALWELDSANREAFGRQFTFQQNANNGQISILVRQQQQPEPETTRAYDRICEKFTSEVGIDAEDQEQFLRTLDSSQLFEKAADIMANIDHIESRGFPEVIRRLFFEPADRPPFAPLFCKFSPESAYWRSFLHTQQQLELIEVRPVGDNQEAMLVRLVDGSDGRVRKRRVLLGTSIEFELASIAICALKDRRPGWKHCSAQLDEGRRLLLTVKTRLNEEGELKVEAFFHRISSASSKKPRKRVKKPKPKPNPEFQSFVEELWAKDVDRVDPEMITLNWQAKLHKNQVADLSPDPLFTAVNETFLQRPIYAALADLYRHNPFYQQVCEQEPPMNAQRRAKFAQLWGLITGSQAFRTAFDYLAKHNKTGGHDFDQFTDQMFDFWFGTYSRCHQPLGSSGFEHVFSGEWRDQVVEGHHNWVRFYLQEKAGDINYHGFFEYQEDNVIGTFQYTWKNYLKRIGGFLFRTSPAFDFSLFTVCVLTQPGDQGCRYQLLQTNMFVSSFVEPCQNGHCIATTYPGIFEK